VSLVEGHLCGIRRVVWCMFWCLFVPGFCSLRCIIMQSLVIAYVLYINELCYLPRNCATPCNLANNRLKIRRPKGRGGSIPPPGTNKRKDLLGNGRLVEGGHFGLMAVRFQPFCVSVRFFERFDNRRKLHIQSKPSAAFAFSLTASSACSRNSGNCCNTPSVSRQARSDSLSSAPCGSFG